jgi:hypothetical protein
MPCAASQRGDKQTHKRSFPVNSLVAAFLLPYCFGWLLSLMPWLFQLSIKCCLVCLRHLGL